MTDETLYTYMNEMLRTTPVSFTRYMYSRIDWKSRLVGIIGPRGIGKSTMVLQYVRQHPNEKSLYVSADHTYFSTHSLVELADEFVKDGGRRLCIDEVHKYKGWSRELKQIYDVHADLSIVFTGSSVLDIQKGEADLSRRALMYAMQGLSFREYLELFHDIKTEVLSLADILAHKSTIPELPHPLPLFRAYLKEGY
ncbi:MAG: AAA family ATPase, partial [Bacteroidales bacterium]|nr:AAA family ATPase [Bacteroidales bacterium]